MPHQASRQLAAMGTSPATNELPLTRAGTHSVQDATLVRSLVELDRSLPSFVQKAIAVLSDELKGFANRGTEPFGKPFPSDLTNINPAMERFREQVSELVDTFIRMLEHRPEHAVQFANQDAVAERSYSSDDHRSIPLLKPPPLVNPGQSGCLVLNLENDDPDETVECALYVTDLVSSSGHRIPAAHINMSPSPVRIPPGGSTEVRIEIRVPRATPPGTYAGLLQLYDGSPERAVLQLSVGV